jgi:hypothetical protein
MPHRQHQKISAVIKGVPRWSQANMAHLAMTQEDATRAHALTLLSSSLATDNPDFKPSS